MQTANQFTDRERGVVERQRAERERERERRVEITRKADIRKTEHS